ncbi:MAG: diguanylate cyclase [Burkholderiales bacterium]|nr:diguanylate cyclase [Burkholderiales bacterium]
MTILAVVGYLAASLWSSWTLVDASTRNRAVSINRLVAEHASARFDQTDIVLLGVMDGLRADDFSNALHIPDARRQTIQTLLKQQQARASGIVSMSITDDSGDVFANSVGTPPGVNLGDRAYFLALKNGLATQPVVSDAILGRVSKKWGIQVARRFNHADGRFAGMIVANIGMEDSFGEFYRTIGLERDMFITLRNTTNMVLVRYPPVQDMVGTVLSGSTATSAVLTGNAEEVVVSVSPLDQIERVVAIRHLAKVPVVSSVGISLAVAYAPWYSELRLAVLVVIGLLLAGWASTLAIRRRDQATHALQRAHAELQRTHDQLDRQRQQLEQSEASLSKALLLAEQTASHDELTGLWNRRSFNQRLAQAVARTKRTGQPLSLIMLDLDHFKHINDTFGHQVGDNVLQVFSALLSDRSRANDFGARWGGEEFILLLEDTTAEQADVLAQHLCMAVAQHDFARIGTLTVSAGVTQFKGDDDDQSLLVRVDRALYLSKFNGRNRVSVVT